MKSCTECIRFCRTCPIAHFTTGLAQIVTSRDIEQDCFEEDMFRVTAKHCEHYEEAKG